MSLIFITGGVRSGKSHFAEEAAVTYYQSEPLRPKRLVYVASGVATDKEMENRIRRHQADRQAQDVTWLTKEAPYQIETIFEELRDGDVILWDCVTTWLTNAFYEGFETGAPCVEKPGCLAKKIHLMKEAILKLLEKRVTLFIVSNEVFDEPPYTSEEVELYRQMLGKCHQWIVSVANDAYEINYGIVKKWK